jgi:hypothetical protein
MVTYNSRTLRWAFAAPFILALIFTQPFSFFPKSDIISVLATVAVTVILVINVAKKPSQIELLVYVVSIASCVLLLFYHNDFFYLKFLGLIAVSLLFRMVSDAFLREVTGLIVPAIVYGSALAGVSFLIFVAIEPTPFYHIDLPDGRNVPFWGLTVINYGFAPNPDWADARPAFLFDEPGQFAHIVFLSFLYAFVSSKYKLTIKDRNSVFAMLLVISGLITLSLAFYLLFLMFFIVVGMRKGSRVAMFTLLISLGIVYLYVSDVEIIERFTNRLSVNDGELVGDNRSVEMERAVSAFLSSPLTGVGWSYAKDNLEHFGASALAPLGYSGLLGVALVMPFAIRLLWLVRGGGRVGTSIALLIALSFAQRPYFYFVIYILLMEGMLRISRWEPVARRQQSKQSRRLVTQGETPSSVGQSHEI